MEYLICFRTLDDVDGELARQWCDDLGFACQIADPRDALFPADADGLVIDLDQLGMPAGERAELVRRLAMLHLPYPVAVASYDLETDAAGTLQCCGLLVYGRLDEALFRELASAIERAHALAA